MRFCAATSSSRSFWVSSERRASRVKDSVKLTITTKAKVDHPVEHRLQKSGSDWMVYDVVIEGVSLVKNYRDQFDAIIGKSGYEGLIKEIKAKHPSAP